MLYSASGLPEELSLDAATGRITGQLRSEGRHVVTLQAQNALGTAERALTIVIGSEIALTPPMGWNSWNCWGNKVTQEKMRAAAHAMVGHQLREHGWSYVNIDDGWQGLRGGDLNAIQPNTKFPDLPGLSAEIHDLGLKLGIYSTPWRASFDRYIGSSADNADGTYEWIKSGDHAEHFRHRFPEEAVPVSRNNAWLQPIRQWTKKKRRQKFDKRMRTFGKASFVQQDARQWTAWGVDYLKYDWVPIDIPHTEEMRRELTVSGRDIVFSVANNAKRTLGPQLAQLANCWRTATDIKDTWQSMSDVGFSRDKWAPFQRPGHYNDPDMLVLGRTRWSQGGPNRLSSDEQYTHMSLWCLLGAPLLLGCDLEKLDAFTLGLITNDEVLEVNQDPLGKQATRVADVGKTDIYAKPLEDGSWAVGLFNRGAKPTSVAVTWSALRLQGPQEVRDLWRQQDLGIFANGFAVPVAAHGVAFARVTPARNDGASFGLH